MTSTNVKILGAVAIFLAGIAGYVIMAAVAPEQDYRGIFIFASTAAGLIGLSSHVDKRTDEMKSKMIKIEHQTNGVLDARIKNAVEAAMRDLGLVPEPPKPARVRKPRITKSVN